MHQAVPRDLKRAIRRKSKKSATIKALDELAREVVFLRDKRKCQLADAGLGSCGGHLQACHIMPKGHYPSLRHEPDNIIAGCWKHHAPQSSTGWHSNPMVYANWFMFKYPARWEYLSWWLKNEFKIPDYEETREKLTAERDRLTDADTTKRWIASRKAK